MGLFSSIASIFSGSAVGEVHAAEADVDAALVAKVKEGDLAAFDGLVNKYRARIFSVVYNLTANREDASDLTQEAFIRAFRSLHKFQARCAFFTWLYQIALNVTYSFLRKNRLRSCFNFENIDEESIGNSDAFEHLCAQSDSDRKALLGELQEKLNEALQKLSPKHRTVVILFEIEGLSHQEIAAILKCSEGTVRSRLHYAKNQLQSYLKSYVS